MPKSSLVGSLGMALRKRGALTFGWLDKLQLDWKIVKDQLHCLWLNNLAN